MDEPVRLVGFTLNPQPYFRPMATLLSARGHTPVLDTSVWLAPNATVVGEVHMGAESTVWFQPSCAGMLHPSMLAEG